MAKVRYYYHGNGILQSNGRPISVESQADFATARALSPLYRCPICGGFLTWYEPVLDDDAVEEVVECNDCNVAFSVSELNNLHVKELSCL